MAQKETWGTQDVQAGAVTLSAERLLELQRRMAVDHWRGREEEARSCLTEYCQLVDALYFNRRIQVRQGPDLK
ncbi:hypothetical protein [Paremcibacter congregatus]|uniref:hypothetical protein n=1 Tax=Paremcibacter congregatus TaxID=2043170 RepID=UPI0030EF52CA|tara:strand:+ start:814 stop:1032 length:219 start_codon:yes stop_codon:yes gene_type:complete